MDKEEFIFGSFMIIIGILAFLVTTPKEGLEILHYGIIVSAIMIGCYFNWIAFE